jgi:hypothetical protein
MSRRRRELTWIPLDGASSTALIEDEPFPPRSAGDLTDLTSSVRIHGIITPLVLRPRGTKLQVVCGYRRLLAARAAGLEEIPAQIDAIEDAEAIRFHLSENLVRKPLDPRSEEEALELLKAIRTGTRRRDETPELPAEGAARHGIALPAETCGLEAMRGTLARMDGLLERLRTDRQLDAREVEAIADAIMDLDREDAACDLRELVRPGAAARLALHSILTASLSLEVGRVMAWDERDMRRLLVASLLHDVGMVFLEHLSFEAARPLGQAERAALESHTRIGCALITAAGAWEPEVALAARDHHERWNGDGYPSRRKTFESSRTGRLVAPLDTYAALVMPRPHRDAVAPERASERVLKAFELGLFDPSLATVFRKAFSPSEPRCLVSASPSPGPLRLPGNSVEMDGPFATMLSKEST